MTRTLARLTGVALLLGVLALTADLGWAADEFKIEDGYTSLFNGKDLTG
jgi:hypothetical protein